MSSQAFRRALIATGYLTPDGKPAAGLTRSAGTAAARLRPILQDDGVGLNADAVFSMQSTPAAIFKDAGKRTPAEDEVNRWHEAAWNVGAAPLLWIITPTEVRLYNCYASPPSNGNDRAATTPLDRFALDSDARLRTLDAMCGRLATETGAFWSSAIGSKIDRRYRVDRELLDEINALEEQLTQLPPAIGPRPTDAVHEIKAARDFAQRLIGRCIFTWYLLDRGIAQRFLPRTLPSDLAEIYATPMSAFKLFSWLRSTFNGDLFPMDDPGAERQRLGGAHLALVRDFIGGRSLVPGSGGQGRLFRFRFNAIPVDLISSIYEQFARSSAVTEADLRGLHYTPVELVHLALDPVFEALPATARIIDPTCGSGAFLVEAFRRLVWKSAQGKPVTRALVRDVLYHHLFGIDINRSALGIAAFSLYLAALELDEEPVIDIADLKFDRLIGATLFEADTIGEQLPAALTNQQFDAVVGNPPWTFVSRKTGSPKRKADNENTLRPRRSPDHAFLAVAARLAGQNGRIGMVMKATPFFSKDIHAIDARSAVLQNLAPTALINLSFLRKEELFPDATGPALLFFARCTLAPQHDKMLVGSIPWTPDFRRTGMFHLGPGEIRAVPLNRVLRTPAFLKAATFGTVRDGWLIEKLERAFPRLEQVLDKLGIDPKYERGQGFIVGGNNQPKPPAEYYKLKVVTPKYFAPFRIADSSLQYFAHPSLERARNLSIFRGPLLLCPKGGYTLSVERGRYSAALAEGDILYTQNLYGISFANVDTRFGFALSGILNSPMTCFQLAFGGATWGLERPTVSPQDLLSLRVPQLLACPPDALEAVICAEQSAAEHPHNPAYLKALDEVVFDLYELEPDERVLARESILRARHLIFENRKERGAVIRPPSAVTLKAYAGQVARSVDAYLRARGERHLEAIIYPRRLVASDFTISAPGVTAVRFVMAAGPPGTGPIVREGTPAELDGLAVMLQGRLEADIPPYLNERRQIRLYGTSDLFILKPTEGRYWTRTAGLNDADTILADHWLERRNVALP